MQSQHQHQRQRMDLINGGLQIQFKYSMNYLFAFGKKKSRAAKEAPVPWLVHGLFAVESPSQWLCQPTLLFFFKRERKKQCFFQSNQVGCLHTSGNENKSCFAIWHFDPSSICPFEEAQKYKNKNKKEVEPRFFILSNILYK